MHSTTRHRIAVLRFMAAVTAYLLARVLGEAGSSVDGALEAVVYGVSAALGLEFLASAWAGLWARSPAGERAER